MAKKAYIKFLVVRDGSPEGKRKIVGYAKWWVPIGKSTFPVEERFPKWSANSDVALCDLFFGQFTKEREALMGNNQYYCKSLPPTQDLAALISMT